MHPPTRPCADDGDEELARRLDAQPTLSLSTPPTLIPPHHPIPPTGALTTMRKWRGGWMPSSLTLFLSPIYPPTRPPTDDDEEMARRLDAELNARGRVTRSRLARASGRRGSDEEEGESEEETGYRWG